jgi:hypothetical protein
VTSHLRSTSSARSGALAMPPIVDQGVANCSGVCECL